MPSPEKETERSKIVAGRSKSGRRVNRRADASDTHDQTSGRVGDSLVRIFGRLPHGSMEFLPNPAETTSPSPERVRAKSSREK